MSDESSNNDALIKAGDFALKTALSQAVRHAVNATVGIPPLGDALGSATSLGYESIPKEVKAGAGVGGFLAVNAATHIISVGTPGAIAYGTAVLGAFFPILAVGAVIGGAIWLGKQLLDE